MRRLKSNIVYRVPSGRYCNHDMTGTSKRCRFCTEVKKGLFVCVLHNEPLLVELAVLIRKTEACRKAPLFKAQEIAEDIMQEEIKQALENYKLTYNELRKKGIAHTTAEQIATQETLEEDKE